MLPRLAPLPHEPTLNELVGLIAPNDPCSVDSNHESSALSTRPTRKIGITETRRSDGRLRTLYVPLTTDEPSFHDNVSLLWHYWPKEMESDPRLVIPRKDVKSFDPWWMSLGQVPPFYRRPNEQSGMPTPAIYAALSAVEDRHRETSSECEPRNECWRTSPTASHHHIPHSHL